MSALNKQNQNPLVGRTEELENLTDYLFNLGKELTRVSNDNNKEQGKGV